uniref:WD40 repeat-containing protein SMU1 n=1 Tax=Albugo laibachii Nc14 TaxID=890382 RepID=F0WYG7_9STRA|nr:conserved hypothetical protein [Albugo laibachii Nc14]|eukprot:CCA26522.1 conserved hypothetical protein [Albugo laibachii Nc14]
MSSESSASPAAPNKEVECSSPSPSNKNKSINDNLAPRWHHVGHHRTTIRPESTFDASQTSIQLEILGMMAEYLQSEGFPLSSAVLQDESSIRLMEKLHDKEMFHRMSKAIQDGNWNLIAKLITKHFKTLSAQQGLLYAICKQEYLELIDRQEYQKAFTFLITHLKPLERVSKMYHQNEFQDLCYLLTCKSVKEASCFRSWEGVYKSRQKLIEQLKSTFEMDDFMMIMSVPMSVAMTNECPRKSDHETLEKTVTGDANSAENDCVVHVPENRLLTLLHQSVAYQMEFSRYHPKIVPKVNTLLRDYECEVVPNAVKVTYGGHMQNVKYVTFLGHDGEFLASGSSDATIKIWPVEPSDDVKLTATKDYVTTNKLNDLTICKKWVQDLRGHTSRVWYLSCNQAASRLYSASGDGTIKIWDLRSTIGTLTSSAFRDESLDDSMFKASILSSEKDSWNSTSHQRLCIATLDATQARTECRDVDAATYKNHLGDIYSVALHPHELHLVTGGYDQRVRLFDIETNTMVKTFRGHAASVCDAQFNRHANLIVSGSKDGTIRFWDILSGLCVHTLRQTLGEVTSISLASNGFILLSGSRNNSNRLWDLRMLHAPRSHLQIPTSTPQKSIRSIYTAAGTLTSEHSTLPTYSRHHQWQESRPVQRFKGHQNTAKNVVRASFGPREAFVLGGSEDGAIYIWDITTGKLLEKLCGHSGVTYNAMWHEKQALMASSSHDSTVKTWWWREQSE